MARREWMHEARVNAKLSLNGLARRADTTPNYVCQIESGEKTPSVPMAKRLAQVLGVHWTRYYED